jgi:hypothetical protein
MTRGTIRTLLRRRLNETVADRYDDSTLNTYIDLAYALVLKQVRKVDPEAVLFWDYRSTVAGVSWYEKPAGTRGPVEVGLKKSSSDTDWTPIPRRAYHVARDVTSADETVYCHRGTYIGIFPAPTVAVTNGIQFLHAPTDTLAADTDVPKLETTLHYAIVLWAALIAKGESPEAADSKDAAELQRLIGDIPLDYGSPDLGQGSSLSPDVADARSTGFTTLSGNGVDKR